MPVDVFATCSNAIGAAMQRGMVAHGLTFVWDQENADDEITAGALEDGRMIVRLQAVGTTYGYYEGVGSIAWVCPAVPPCGPDEGQAPDGLLWDVAHGRLIKHSAADHGCIQVTLESTLRSYQGALAARITRPCDFTSGDRVDRTALLEADVSDAQWASFLLGNGSCMDVQGRPARVEIIPAFMLAFYPK